MSEEYEILRKFYMREAGIYQRERYWKRMRRYFYYTILACALIALVAWTAGLRWIP